MNENKPTPIPTTGVFADARVLEVSAFGVRVRIVVGGTGRDEAVESISRLWARCDVRELTGEDAKTDHAGPVIPVVLDEDESRADEAWDLDGIAAETLEILNGLLVPGVTYRAIGSAKGQLLMVHAAGVADTTTGRTAVLVAGSGTGKSTAAITLSKHFGYVTDETVAFTEDLQLLPYPKPISLFPDGRDWGKLQHSPDDLGLLNAPREFKSGPVVFLERNPEAKGVVLEDVDLGTAIALIAENTSYTGSYAHPLHRIADFLNSASALVKISYAEATDLVSVIAELLTEAQTFPAPEPYENQSEAPSLAELDLDVAAYGLWFARLPLMDVYASAGGGAAMTMDSRVVGLSPMAARVLTLIGDGRTNANELSVALANEFGAPPEQTMGDGSIRSSEEVAIRHTDEIVADLINQGLVIHVGSPEN